MKGLWLIPVLLSILILVVMGISAVTPVLAHDIPGHRGVLVTAFSNACSFVPDGKSCVAPDADLDGTCDVAPFFIPTAVANRLGINSQFQFCVFISPPP